MDAVVESVEIGGKIMTLSGQLAPLKAERDALNEKIQVLEKELLGLAGRYSELVSATLSAVMPKPLAFVAAAPTTPPPTGPSPGDEKVLLMRRVKGFLNNAEPGTSASQIADALKVDAALVREVMRDLSQA